MKWNILKHSRYQLIINLKEHLRKTIAECYKPQLFKRTNEFAKHNLTFKPIVPAKEIIINFTI